MRHMQALSVCASLASCAAVAAPEVRCAFWKKGNAARAVATFVAMATLSRAGSYASFCHYHEEVLRVAHICARRAGEVCLSVQPEGSLGVPSKSQTSQVGGILFLSSFQRSSGITCATP